ncbi:biliverdin-producing heme oxygenase [Klenkia sp. PcliD-1-E]|uniref:biliverdin-producing heme oxygenase n=1 Tax=Klenkia sp. PcliD-1-E TaxID=2954492 RepID=UPI0020983A33|nr:biliverdin-producing heme oxygenase [Klenkia sp. PcliD-1-E]MCO7222343.1 biliverdin-producing heme oxygenase [Klenkia sp. PcliD-1-E]
MSRDARTDDRSPDDVMAALRAATAAEHQQLEDTLDLMDDHLTVARLTAVLQRMHAFWVAAETGLDTWAATDPGTAEDLDWAGRRRADLFAADLAALGAVPTADPAPAVPAPSSTDEALGTMYVLEGSTLGGVFIDRHLASLPALAGVGTVRAFSPYGERTGARWAAFRRTTREHVTRGGDADAVVGAARRTFVLMAQWCADVEQRASPPSEPATRRRGAAA